MTTKNDAMAALPHARALTLAIWAALPALAAANPIGPEVVSGQASFQQSGNTLTVTNTPGAILNWQSFSIAEGEVTRFVQQSAASTVLNRIVGQDPSMILGSLQSNGQVFLLNPNGVVFGPNAQVDVAGLVASTLNLTNADFLAGRLSFSAELEAGAIRNDGAIRTLGSGNIYLIAPTVENHGIIQASDGAVVLAAGSKATLVDTHRPDVRVEIAAPQDQAVNVGMLIGGHIGIYGGAIRQDGIVSATQAVVGDGGTVIFKAASSVRLGAASRTLATGDTGGTIHIDGTGATVIAGQIQATGHSGQGGRVAALGDRIELSSGAGIDASGAHGGGTVHVGGGLQGADPEFRNALSAQVSAGATLSADAHLTGTGGEVIVWSDGRTDFAGAVSARGGAHGGDGGFAEVSGREELVFQGSADLRAPAGRTGELLLDPGSVVIDTTAGAAGDGVNTFAAATLSGLLAQADVTIRTSTATNGQPETITVSGTGALTWASANTLSLIAGNGIAINSNVSMAGGGTLAFSAPSATTLGAVTITGGRLQDNGTAGLLVTNSNTILSGVTLASRLAVPTNNAFRIRNGLVLDGGSVFLTNNSTLHYEGNQSLTASAAGGQILFASPAGSPNNNGNISPWSTAALAIGPGVTVRPDTATPGGGTLNLSNGATAGSFAGTLISANGRTFTVSASGTGGWDNAGRIEASGGIVTLNSATSSQWRSSGNGRLVLGTGGTLNLDGTFSTASFETLQRDSGAGTLNLAGTLDNAGDILTLDASTGTLNATSSGSIIRGGRIEGEPGRLVLSAAAVLDAVTLATRVDVATSQSMRIRNGLVLDGGSVLLANNSNLYYEGDQSLTASAAGGQILFASPAGSPNNNGNISPWSTAALAIGPGVTVRSDTATPGGGTLNLSNGATAGSFAGTLISANGRTFTVSASGTGGWDNAGRIEASGGIVTLNSATSSQWRSSGNGRLVLGTGGTLNLDGTFSTASFETLQRDSGAGTLNLTGTLDNAGDILTLDASTGTLNATSSASIIRGGRIEGEPGRLVLSAAAVLDAVTLATRVDAAANQSMRIRNGLVLDGGSVFLANNSNLYYEGNQSLTASAAGGQILFASPAGSPNNNGGIRAWGSSALAIGPGVTVRPDTATPGGGTVELSNNATAGSFAGTLISANGRTFTVSASGTGGWDNAGRIEASGGIVTLNSAGNGQWRSSGNGRLVLGTGGTLNLDGTFSTASFETLQRDSGAGTLNLTGTLDNAGDILTLDASTGALNATSSGSIIRGGRIEGEPGRLVLSAAAVLDAVTLGTRVDVAASDSMRIRNGLVLDGGSVFLTNNSNLYYEGNQSLTASAAGGQILFASPAGSPNNNNGVRPWGGSALTLGPGITIRPDAVTPGGGTVDLSTTANAEGSNAGTVLANLGRTLTVTSSASPWTNSGTLAAVGGTLTLTNLGASTGPLEIDNGGTLNLSGTIQAAALNSLAPSGAATTVNISGTVVNTGSILNFNAAKGVINLVSGGRIVGGTVTIDGSFLNVSDGRFQDVTLGSDLTIRGGQSLRVAGALTLDGSTLTLAADGNGSALVYGESSAPWRLAGTGNVVLGGTTGQNQFGFGGSPLTLESGITLASPRGGTVNFGTGANDATIGVNPANAAHVTTLTGNGWSHRGTIAATSGVLNVNGLLANEGTLRVAGATTNLNVGDGASRVWTNTGQLILDSGTLTLGGTLTTATLDSILRPDDADRGTLRVAARIDNNNSILTLDARRGPVYFTSASGVGTVLGGIVDSSPEHFLFDFVVLENTTLRGSVVVRGAELRVNGALTLDDALVTMDASAGGTGYIWNNLSSTPWTIDGDGELRFSGANGNNWIGWSNAPLTLGPGVLVTGTQGGIIEFGAGGVNHAMVRVAPTNPAAFLRVGGANWDNRGTFEFTTANATIDDLPVNNGTILVDGAAVTISGGDGNTFEWTNPGTLRLDRGTLTLDGRITAATLNSLQRPNDADRGTLNLAGALDNTGTTTTFDAARGPVSMISDSVIDGGTVIVTDDALRVRRGRFDNVTLGGSLTLQGQDVMEVVGALVLDQSVVTLDSTDGATYLWGASSGTPWSVGGTGRIVFAGANRAGNLGWSSAPLTLGESVRVEGQQAGTVQFGTGGINRGTIAVTPTNAAALMLLTGTDWSNEGSILISTGTTDIAGLRSNPGSVTMTGGTLGYNTQNNHTFAWTNAGAIALDSGTLTLGGLLTPTVLDSIQRPVDADRGALRISGLLDNANATTVFDAARGTVQLVAAGGSRGTIRNGAIRVSDAALRLEVASLSNLSIEGELVLLRGDTALVDGTVTLVDGAHLVFDAAAAGTGGSIFLYNPQNSAWSIAGTGTVRFLGAGSLNNLGSGAAPLTLGENVVVVNEPGGGGRISMGTGGVNRGTVVADAQRIDFVGTNWTNEGTLRATNQGTLGVSGLTTNAGLLDLGARSLLTTSNADLLNTGTIRGMGTIELTTDTVNVETLTNRGTLRLGDTPGLLTITGNLRLEPGSTVVMNIADNALGRGAGYDSITVTGMLTPGGTVQIAHLDGFQPAASDLFLLFSPGSLGGTLANTTLSGASAGYALTPAGSQAFLTRGSVGTINTWNRDTNGDWSVGTNWGLGRAPQAGDLVFIDRGGANPTVTIASGTQTAGRLLAWERIAMSGGTLTVDEASELRAPFNWTGGTLAGSGTLSLLADSSWSRGTLNGTLRVGAGATLTGDGNGDGNSGTARALGSGSLIVDGTLAMVSGQTDIVASGAIINNGLIEFRGPMNIGDRWTGNGTFTFTNNASGVLRSVNNAGVQIGSLGIPGGTPNYANFTNDGLIDVQSGTTRFNIGFSGASGGGTFTNRGTIQVASGATVDFGGPATFAAGSTITGGGNLSTSLGANLQLAGTFGLTGTVLVPTGTLTFATPTAASVSNLQVTGGTVNTTTNVTVGTLTLSGGQLGGTGQMTVGGGGTWSGGTVAGRVRIAQGATLGVTGTGTKALSGATVDNDGQIHLDGVTVDVLAASTLTNTGTIDFRTASLVGDASGGTGSLTLDNSGTLRHTSTGVSTLGSLAVAGGTANYVILTNRAGGQVDTVAGTLRINASPAGGVPGGSFVNEGTIDVGAGTTLQVGGTFTTTSGSTLQVADTGTFRKTGGFTNAAGALITGRGGIDVGAGNALVNAGRLMDGSGANRLTVTGDLTLTDTSLVSVGIGGPTGGTDFDRIDVSGTTTLGGALQVALLDPFTPADGDRFPFIGTAATAGSFATAGVTLPAQFRVITPGLTVGVEFVTFTCGADICWDGGASTRQWTDAANWTGDRLPGPGDIVLVDTGDTTPIVLANGSHTIGGITMRDALTLSGGSLTITGGSLFSAPITLAGGSLALQGNATVEAILAVQSGALTAGAAFNATAPVSVTGGSATFNGATDTGVFTQTNGTATFNGITTVERFAQSGGASAFNGATTLGALTLEGGETVTLSGTGDVRVIGPFDWRNESDLRGTGTLTTEGVTTVTGSGGAGFGLVKAWVNLGTVNLENGAQFHLATETSKGAITNASGAVFRLGTGATPFIVFNGSQYVFTNAGTLIKDSVDTQSLPVGLTIENTGTIRLTDGLLFANTALQRNAGTLEMASPASITFGGDHVNDGTIRGSGTIDVGLGTGRLTNNGSILVRGAQGPGALGLAGNFTQSAAGVLDIEVPSGVTGQQGVLAIGGDGAATLDGTLRITAAGSYAPAEGQVLRPLLTYVSRTGGFARVELPAGTTFTASADYGPTVLSVSILTAACAADACWIAGSGDWGVASNWSTGAVPTGAQSVRISVAGDQIITVSGGDQAVGSIVMDEALRVAAGSITIGGAATFRAPVTIEGGSLIAQGPATFAGLALTGGALQVADARVNGVLDYAGGTLSIGNGGTLTIGPAGSLAVVNRTIVGGGTLENEGALTLERATLQGSLVNRGTTTVTGGTTTVGGTGSRLEQEGGSLIVESGATLAKDGGELAWNGGTLGGTGAIERRSGAVLALGAGDKVLDGLALTLDALALQGRLNLARGSLTVAGDTHILSGSALELSGGTFTPGGRLDNDGMLALRSGSLDLANDGTHTGTFDLGAGTLLGLTAPGRHELQTGALVTGDGVLEIRGGSLDVSGDVSASRVRLADGSLLGGGTLSIEDQFIWTGGTQSGSGRTVVAQTGALLIDGAARKLLEGPRQLINDSVSGSRWTGTGDVDAEIPSSILSTFTNNGLLEIDTGAQWRDGFIVNNGTIVKTGTSAEQVFNAESGGLLNAGLIEIRDGTIRLRGTGAQTGEFALTGGGLAFEPGTHFIGGSHTLADGARFTGAGRVVVDGAGFALEGTSVGSTIANGVTLDLTNRTVSGDGTLLNAGTLILANSRLGGTLENTGVVQVLGDSVHDGARVAMNGGRIAVAQGSEVVKDGGTFVWSDGTLAGRGSYDLANGATFATGGSGTRVIDGAAIRLPALDVDAGSLELRSGSLTVGTGLTRFGPGAAFVVDGGTAELFGPADIANLRVNGGTFHARQSLAAGSLLQTGGAILGGGDLTIRDALATTGGTFARTWQSIDITQGTGDLTLNRSLDTTGSFVARVRNGALRIVNAEIFGRTVEVVAGSLALTAGTSAAALVGDTRATADIAGAMTLQGGTAPNATAEFGARAGECGIDAASLSLSDGTTLNTGARIIGSPTLGTAAQPLGVAQDRITVNGVRTTANGQSGFFIYDTADEGIRYVPADVGGTLFLRGISENPAPPPPPPAAVEPGAIATVVVAAVEPPLVAERVTQQAIAVLATRTPSFVAQVQTDDELVAAAVQSNGGGACR